MLTDIIKKVGFENEDTLAICMYGGNLVLVPCEDCVSGIYEDYKRAVTLISSKDDGDIVFLKYCDYIYSIDAMIIRKKQSGYEISFASDSHDGFQVITYETIKQTYGEQDED